MFFKIHTSKSSVLTHGFNLAISSCPTVNVSTPVALKDVWPYNYSFMKSMALRMILKNCLLAAQKFNICTFVHAYEQYSNVDFFWENTVSCILSVSSLIQREATYYCIKSLL